MKPDMSNVWESGVSQNSAVAMKGGALSLLYSPGFIPGHGAAPPSPRGVIEWPYTIGGGGVPPLLLSCDCEERVTVQGP